MADTPDDEGFKPPSLIDIVSQRFRRPSSTPPATGNEAPTNRILEVSERRAAMSTLDAIERKWATAGIVLAVLGALAVILVYTLDHKTTGVGHHKKVAVAPDALLLGVAVLAFAIVGIVGLRKRKRSLVVFTLFILGLAMTLIQIILGFAIVGIGAWLMVRANRIQKYGTPNMKMVSREAAAARPSRKQRQQAAKAPAKPSGNAPPKASKRYTPKAPSKKRPTKPVS